MREIGSHLNPADPTRGPAFTLSPWQQWPFVPRSVPDELRSCLGHFGLHSRPHQEAGARASKRQRRLQQMLKLQSVKDDGMEANLSTISCVELAAEVAQIFDSSQGDRDSER